MPAARRYRGCGLLLAAIVAGGIFGLGPAAVGAADAQVGLRIYRQGMRPSGEPLTAIVAGDVPLLGTQFSCRNCHGLSGMGSAEGAYIVPAIAGPQLFAPSPQPRRPAYDLDSLAHALRDGVSPSGRVLDSVMPRFRLDDEEVAAIAAYLERLSVGPSAGTDDKVIRFATVVTADIAPALRSAVLDVIETFVDEKNRQTRLEAERWDRGSTPESRLPTVYRDWALEVWTLEGPSDSWRAQLDQHYLEAPVFALLGGLSAGSWGPIGRFCEDRQIPCLFPSTDLPDARESDLYTMYFTPGLELEAGLIASHLAEHPAGKVVQIYCGPLAARAARSLGSMLLSRSIASEDIVFDCDQPASRADLAARLGGVADATAVVWLGRERLSEIAQQLSAGRVYLSSTLNGGDPSAIPDLATANAFLAHPFRLPGRVDPALLRFKAWARARGLQISHLRYQAEAFFACQIALDAVKHLDKFLLRDYVLDMLDHAQGMAIFVPMYPRPTFGPEQRFLTKGGYLVPWSSGGPDTRTAFWIRP